MESISKVKPAQKLPLVDREFSQPGKQDDIKHYDSQTVRNTPRHPPASTHRERSLTATSSIFASTASAIVKLVFTESSMTTTFIVERTTTLDNILDLGLQKLKKTHNIEYDKTHTKMSTELDNKALDLSTVLENLEYVQKCLAQHKSPVFKISPAKKSPLRPLQVLFQHQYSSYSASHKTPEFTSDPKKGPLSCPPATQNSALHDILFSSSKTTKTHSPEESIISESSAASSQSLGALPSLRTDSQPRIDTNNIAVPRSPYTPLTLHIPGGSFDDLLGEIATENTENPDTAIGSRSLAEKESFYSIKTDSSNGSSTISSTSSGIPSRRNTGSLNKPSPASLIKPSPLSSKASILDSSPENTTKSMPSLTTEKGMPLKKQLSKQLSSAVIIKLLLPDGITTHVMAVQRMTVDTLLEKALLKIKRLQGSVLKKSEVLIFDYDGNLLQLQDVVEDLEYVKRCVVENSEPIFKIQLGPDSDDDTDSNASNESVFSVIAAYSKSDPHLQNRESDVPTSTVAASTSPTIDDDSNRPKERPVLEKHGQSSTALLGDLKFIRVELPRGISTNLPVKNDITVEALMEKCRQKMERMLAVNVAKEEIQLLPDKSDQVLSPSTIVCDLEFVKEAFQSGAVPTIRVVRKSSASTPTVNIPEESENTANHRLTILRDRPARQANTLSVYATVSNYTSDYLAMYHKSQEDAGARMNIVVRVQMPHGLSPNMVISKRMTTGALLIKAIAKMNSMTKQTLDSSDCRLQIPSLDEELHMDDIIDELDYVNRCIAQNEIPTFIISLRDPGALGDNQKPLPPLPLVVKPPQLPIVNISNPEPDLDSSTAFILSPTSPTSPSYEPTNMIRSRRSPSDAERPVTRISPEDVLRQSIQSESVVEFYEPLPSPISSTGKRSSTASRILMRPESVSSVRSTSPQVFAISFIIPQKEISNQVQDPMRLDFKFTGDESIFSIKESLWKSKDFPQLRYEMNQYSLQYVHPKTKHRVELLDEDQVLRTLSTYREFHHSDLTIHLCSKKKDVGPKAQQLSKGIGNLINFSLYRFDSLKNPEIDLVRRRLNNVSRDVKTNSKDSHIQDISANIESSKVPPHILSKLAGVSCKLHLRVHLPLENHVVKTVSCDAYDTPSEIIQRVLSKYKKFLRNGDNDEKFYFKISGVQEYLVPESSMINYAYVRRQFCKGERIVLTLTTLPNVSEADEDNEEELDKEACYVEESPDSVGSHSEVTIMGRDVNSIKWMSLWDITSSFKIYIHKCEFPNQASLTIDAIYVEAALLLGSQLLCQPVKTRVLDIAPILRWNSTLDFVFPMYNLPKNTKLCLTLFARANTRKKGEPDRESDYSPLGWASALLIDRRGLLRQGAISLKLWKTEQLNSINATVSAKRDSDPTLQIRLEEYTHPVVFPCMDDVIDSDPIGKDRQVDINPPDQRMVREILSYDSLVPLEEVEKTIIWRNRYPVINMPNGLLKVLISARWHLLEDVLEVKRMLRICKPIPPESALGLLDSTFADDHVRSYAVDRLAEMPDDDLIDYILQLVQALKYESRLDSKLARFLLRRALANTTVGHHFFWHLKSEMDHPESSILCAVLLEAYLRGNPKHLKQLTRASSLIYKLRDVAMAVKNLKTPPERKAVMVNMMSSINIPGDIALPLDPRFLVKNLVVDKCKYMDSKKLPLWCVFKNDDATGHDIYAIFKSGDDLRQDMLCLQMIRIMDKLWQREGLDLKMIPYKCITTGHEMGMIEVVLHSATVSSIQLSYGGSTAAFKEEPLEEWIRKHNPDEDDYDKAVETFTLSCAGYCVATYCLGIGDRHNDNIMCSKRGNLFHIDFGHFLGNTKRKFGIKRERAPFVLTPDFIYVISKKDSANFSQFLDLCIRAYLILRRHANTFITLFALMLTTGIPELRTVDDLAYLRDAFCLGLSEEEAADEFRSCIFESIRLGWSTQLNWWVHNLVHAK